MYDLLIVGAGLTAATLAARLKGRLQICVIDCRNHLGGNCFDDCSDGSFVHHYGPHIFHSPSTRVTSFLGKFTEWVPYSHKVTAEIEERGELRYVPFPYCRQTAAFLGRELNKEEIIDTFYRGYSQKMWGGPWEALPQSIQARVPKNTLDKPSYYRDQFVALPKFGYTRMIGNMLDGVELILGAPADEWTKITAQTIIYTGRPDLIPLPGQAISVAEANDLQLNFRTLDIRFAPESWPDSSACLHACTLKRDWTRKTNYSRMTGGNSRIISTEWPRQAARADATPYYPIETPEYQSRYAALSQEVVRHYPNLHLEGRLGSYRYLDMYQAVGRALNLAQRVWNR
jgi:UDP-galactopyranose mutase